MANKRPQTDIGSLYKPMTKLIMGGYMVLTANAVPRSKGNKCLIIHADDLGMCHSINAATFYASHVGAITSASVMVPCAWFREVVHYAKAHPEFDLGVHLTLTSEWSNIRWRPITNVAKDSALIDLDGFFCSNGKSLKLVREDLISSELHAQITTCLESGLRPTHIDSHMFALFTSSALYRVYLRLANTFNIPCLNWPFLMASSTLENTDTSIIRGVDRQYQAPKSLNHSDWMEFYLDTIMSLSDGINQLTVHLGYDDDELRAAMGADTFWGSSWRRRDLAVITSRRFRMALEQRGVSLIGWQEIATRWSSA